MRVLVAGIGNIFFGDDAFGPEVAQALLREPQAPDVKVEDFGIRALHLAYELLDGYDRAIIIDTFPARRRAGHALRDRARPRLQRRGTPDAHRMDLSTVFAFVRMLDGAPPPIPIVGCEPETIEPEWACPPPWRAPSNPPPHWFAGCSTSSARRS